MQRFLFGLGVVFSILLVCILFKTPLSLLVGKEMLPMSEPVDKIDSDVSGITVREQEKQNNEVVLAFVGDIMLARNVENLMRSHDPSYPYSGLEFKAYEYDFLVGNFEASVPTVHEKTPSGSFRFSVDPIFLPSLSTAGFTHVSLANNHALDFGQAGYEETVKQLTKVGIKSFGHPNRVSTTSVTYLQRGTVTVALIGLHTLFTTPDDQSLSSLMADAITNSDLQIIYVHWGEEYVSKPDKYQIGLATKLVQLGADLIIGHHPHVMQSVGMIDDVPVFYSLGNYIFDQYFSAPVQEGLMLVVHTKSGKLERVELVPVTSREKRSVPTPVLAEEKLKFLTSLASISDETLVEEITAANISFTY